MLLVLQAYTDGQQTTHDTTFNDLMSTLRTARNALNTDQSVQTTISVSGSRGLLLHGCVSSCLCDATSVI